MPVAKKSGLSVRTFKGLNDKRMKKNDNANFGLRLAIKQGDTVSVQFLYDPDQFDEFDQHSWNDGGRWNFVPCVGEECPICQDEDSKRAKKNYRFACLVYNISEKKVQILEGPKDLAGRIAYRYKRKPALFLKRTFEITKFPTTPVTYDCAVGEDDLVSAAVLKAKAKGVTSVEDYLEGEAKSFYGSEIPTADLSSKRKDDDDDDDEDEDEDETVEYTVADLKKMKLVKLQGIAEDLEIDTDDLDKTELIEAIIAASSDDDDEEDDDEDDDDEDSDEDEDDDDSDDEDDDEDEDDEDDDEDDVPVKKSPAKKSAAKKTVAKKAASRRR